MDTIQVIPDEVIRDRIRNAPQMASLRSINQALSELVKAETSFTSQIAEIIRRDPSLTARLLKLVNSVFYGLARKVTHIEEAIFYLGLRQIRELALATPVIEDFQNLTSEKDGPEWPRLWQHSIGTAILSRQILALAGVRCDGDADYIVGLVHNVGRIVMAAVFPGHFQQIFSRRFDSVEALCAEEEEVLGWNHARVGACFLENHQLSPEIVGAVGQYPQPHSTGLSGKMAAAVHLASSMTRHSGILGVEKLRQDSFSDWETTVAWRLLFEDESVESLLGIAPMRRTLDRLPVMLNGML